MSQIRSSATLSSLSPELIARFAAIVGARHALSDPDQQLPYLREWRDMYAGRASLVLRPGSTEEVSKVLRVAHEHAIPVVPQAGNTGLVGGHDPNERRDRALRGPAQAGAVRRSQGLHHDRGGRPHPGRGAGCGRQGGPAVPPEPAVGGHLPDRRQPRHQRRRGGRAGLRQHPPAGAGPRGGAGRRPRVERSQRPQEGQHGLRPQGFAHRLGGHAGCHHRRGAQAVPQARREGHRLRRPARPRLRPGFIQPGPGDGRPQRHGLRGDGASRARHHRHARGGRPPPLPRPAPVVRAAGDLGPQGRRHRRAGAHRHAHRGQRARHRHRRRHRQLARPGARLLAAPRVPTRRPRSR